MASWIRLIRERIGQVGAVYEQLHDLSRRIETESTETAGRLARLQRAVDESKVLTAQGLIRSQRELPDPVALNDVEFQVFSQFGDDGIIQYLVHRLQIEDRSFVEIGVTDYREANTRFLLVNDNWRGLVVDGDHSYIDIIKRDPVSWRHDLTAVCSFVTTENVSELIRDAGFAGDLGLLSIDIDGNDYWVWEALQGFNPVVVVVEYNSLFGPTAPVTVPYDASFERAAAHWSHVYYGTSLAALCHLATQKGYSFIGTNSAGNNAYFVRDDRLSGIASLSSAEGFRAARFREARTRTGAFSHAGRDEQLQSIAEMPLVNVRSGRSCKVAELASDADPGA